MARTRSVPQRTLPRKPLAALWRRHALPTSRRRSTSRSDDGLPPAKKKARTTDDANKSSVPLPADVLVNVLRFVAWMCPRTAVGCRLVSRSWRQAATDSSVQGIVWEQSIGVRPLLDKSREDNEAKEDDEDDPERNGDVVAALVRVEHEILHARFHDASGYPFTGGDDPGLKWLDERFSHQLEVDRQSDEELDDGMAVRGCADRKWWRAAETLVTACAAVDHRFARPQWGRLSGMNGPHISRGTGEDAVLDAAVDAGDVGLCRALLRCPQTAVAQDGWTQGDPVCRYGFGHEMHPRGELWHSVEALRNGQIELAAMLVSPRDDEDGGGQLAMPLLQALCTGDVEWSQALMPAVNAAVCGVRARLELVKKLREKKGRLHVMVADGISRQMRDDMVNCRLHLENLTNPLARGELDAVIVQLAAPPVHPRTTIA